jgi:predicted acetyltransferase
VRFFPRIYDRVRRTTPGFFVRSRDWWQIRRITDSPERRGDAGPLNHALVEVDGRPVAYALYRISQKEEEAGWKRRLHVVEALGLDPVGTREIWRFLLEIDWIHEVRTSLLPVDHPLFHLVARPDSLKLRTETGLWVRLVDVGAALSSRRYATDGRVTFEVADAFGSWNEGSWTLDGGVARRTRRRPDLRLDITALGAAYLGGFSFRHLAAAGLVEEMARGGIARADAIFATSGPAPWCPEIF